MRPRFDFMEDFGFIFFSSKAKRGERELAKTAHGSERVVLSEDFIYLTLCARMWHILNDALWLYARLQDFDVFVFVRSFVRSIALACSRFLALVRARGYA